MTQDIYDNDEFFAGCRRQPRSVEGLKGAPEWPALQLVLTSSKAPSRCTTLRIPNGCYLRCTERAWPVAAWCFR
jgi:hypothetical protein